MAAYDFSTPRLFLEADLEADRAVALSPPQYNYLCNVLRLSEGGGVHVFNGRDGEWRGSLEPLGRKRMAVRIGARTRSQTPPADLHYLFAPLKHARLDYMVQKAVEMGAGTLRPVATRRTQPARVKTERMRANAIEAAEQCGILTLPDVAPLAPLDAVLGTWAGDRLLVFCDEDAPIADPVAALRAAIPPDLAPDHLPVAVLIGPEGGFDPEERDSILSLPRVVRLSLGPRILRADTAAVAALALVQAVIGDRR